MTLKNKVSKVFIPVTYSNLNIEEKFTSVSISDFEISNFLDVNLKTLDAFRNLINDRDSFSLFFKVTNQDAILFDSANDFAEPFAKLKDEQNNFESKEDTVKVEIEINKDTTKAITVYDFQKFGSFWKSLTAKELLALINQYKKENGSLVFHTMEPTQEEFYSNNISFTSSPEKFTIKENTIRISDYCHFSNYSNFPFTPQFFELLKIPKEENIITESLNKLSLVFSIISLFDITSIDNKGNLYYKLNGYRSFESWFNINNLSIQSKDTYYKIFQWSYSESSHVSDKIGLVRNILSLSLENGSIGIEENVYHSIQSSYQAYLKDNIKNYIEIRGKVTDELSWIAQKSGDMIDKYISNYQKSIFTFLSFFISVFVLRIISKGSHSSVFNKDSTLLSLAFLALSSIFLIFSSWNLSVEKERLKRKYQNLKDRYKDLLVQKDIENILNNDSEFEYELGYIRKRFRIYLGLWIITITILLIAVLVVSDYITIELIKNKIPLLLQLFRRTT
ncbi:hypothetical protein KO507_03680 [Gilvimarinus agarilyticus]|uniref:hypothetical protein n=1 Tax=Reichenbachiella agariperforans TaxID=156994 RepID=UPI001C09F69D|nr:hypothetical protein [Reichenbachiella agariperforans]MBU2884864.1 hypothetical protein [Gilvimarinus agarilyticus]MBU2914157.1 hypothetical protein [Reichenbachiella agariperforans]